MNNSVYVGKSADKTGSYEMCLVIDSNISDASALVYNIAKNVIEVLPFGMWHRQAQVFQEICEENRYTWQYKLDRAMQKQAAFVAEFNA